MTGAGPLPRRPAALLFDVFGTLVDWRGTIARAAPRLLAAAGQRPGGLDGGAFAEAWRAEYQPAMEAVRSGARGYVSLDVLHAENLDRILPRFGLGDLAAAERAALTGLWHRLDAWPEVGAALARLGAGHWLAPLSNGPIVLMAGLARHNGWRWDAVLGAEIARDYKPAPGVYRAGCAAPGLAPGDCLMVAAHSDDLAAARAAGLMTAHVARPDEAGPGRGETAPRGPVDLAARDLADLAGQLGC